MKLIKIRFTAWRDQSAAPRSPALQEQLDAWTRRLSVLSAAAARIKDKQAHADSEMLQKSLARITAEMQKIDDERTLLLSVEGAAADAEVRAASEHKNVGTFGYQVWNDAGVHLLVDAAGNYLPATAAFAYEVVDDDPPLPAWGKRSAAK